MPLHRDVLNMIGHANHAITLGNFMEARSGQKLLCGTWVDTHDEPRLVQCSEISHA